MTIFLKQDFFLLQNIVSIFDLGRILASGSKQLFLYPGAVEAMLNAVVYTSSMRQHLRIRDNVLMASAFFIHCTCFTENLMLKT